ncbi:hypothetical protein [Cellulomonas edaphi]|uniref:Large exoprotein n=1 Tax=Cellulomonas edaphi TaxID=3053468 RepID=A0ABT7S4W4_9CELL|nr:hypothetical protein [Cellulomons edaphi]MDM7830645.1 hypothetical protein [Cellulomons edaphi]
MTDLAGPVALALVVLWVAYLVPHKLRHRQQLLESRADDRYSDALRVVAVSDRSGRSLRTSEARRPAARSTTGLLTPGKGVPVRRSGPDTGGTTVDRPTATQDRIATEAARRTAQARAAHAAATARRGAAARRRGMLAGFLTLATVAGWVVAGVAPAVTWVAGAIPTVLLATVVVLGRRAVLAGRAADVAWENRQAAEARAAAARTATPARGTLVARSAAPGRAVRPSNTDTEMFAAVVIDSPAADADGWSPVPVPRPTYTMKAPAPRREPAALENLEGSTAVRPAEDARTEVRVAEPVAETTGSIDLDAVLAKRRASGE